MSRGLPGRGYSRTYCPTCKDERDFIDILGDDFCLGCMDNWEDEPDEDPVAGPRAILAGCLSGVVVGAIVLAIALVLR